MRSRALVATLLPVLGAAALGNAFVGRDSLDWFRGLRRPRLQLPMAGFYAVGAAYYVVMSVVTYRAALREDARCYRLAMVVLAGNELWNVALFGRRSPREGFLGILAFLIPLGSLQVSLQHDRTSTFALGSYTAYVVA